MGLLRLMYQKGIMAGINHHIKGEQLEEELGLYEKLGKAYKIISDYHLGKIPLEETKALIHDLNLDITNYKEYELTVKSFLIY